MNPYQGKKLQQDAWEAGWEAMSKNIVGAPNYPARSAVKAWQEGNLAASKFAHETRIAEVQTRKPELATRKPELAKVVEDVYRRGVPCPKCRRVMTDVGGQAVVIKVTANGFAYCVCKCCRGDFKLRHKAGSK